jgi:2-(1,2-epoxy-1,2-dihydrophenyl)acetyl-CoA isomerase
LHLGFILSIEAERPVRDAAIDLATRLAKGPPVAQAMSKQLFEATTLSFDQFLDREFMVQPLLATTADHREGLAATRDKRAPNFIGR